MYMYAVYMYGMNMYPVYVYTVYAYLVYMYSVLNLKSSHEVSWAWNICSEWLVLNLLQRAGINQWFGRKFLILIQLWKGILECIFQESYISFGCIRYVRTEGINSNLVEYEISDMSNQPSDNQYIGVQWI